MAGLTVISSDKYKIQWQDGSVFYDLVGVTSTAYSGGEAESRTVRALGGQTAAITGTAGVPSASFAAIYAPSAYANDRLAEEQAAGNVISLKEVIEETELFSNASVMVAIDTAGVVAFTGGSANDRPSATPNDFQQGMCIKIGTGGSATYHRIESVSSAGAFVTRPAPASALAATAFTIVVPGTERTVRGKLTEYGNISVDTDGEMTHAMGFQPSGRPGTFAPTEGSYEDGS